ncbi:ribonuclease P protein component 1 [Halobacterium bonnevillei]|jgi:ribonuclease P protein subunit POP4|uniref:Ribonuclease P protein component 1 n=1 Tax=Halobacterium bonnevillei TaxID=2692200 RepID=A0A6B0SI96_9EURY|nr:ribonuclease P protein component 1 [Halobacterium bonnevillei]MXR20276.1 ribonuclease P [Halobacterium bonnevillei]
MTVTPETLPRHELVGLHVRVVESTDPSRVGIEGEVVRETMRTLVLDTGRGGSDSDSDVSGVKQIPKRGTTFEFRLTDEAAVSAKDTGTASQPAGGESQTTGEGVAYVTVDGVALLSRPATRSENGVDSKWR